MEEPFKLLALDIHYLEELKKFVQKKRFRKDLWIFIPLAHYFLQFGVMCFSLFLQKFNPSARTH